MTITLPSTACRRSERAVRLAHRTAADTAPVPPVVPAPREAAEPVAIVEVVTSPLPAGRVTTRSPRTVPSERRIRRNAVRDQESAAQGLAFAGESASLRERADRYVAIVEAGGAVDGAAARSILRSFRSYEPFLAGHDRALNAVAYRRLAAALAPERLAA